MIAGALLLAGLAFGSFINALVWRLHQQQLPKKKQLLSQTELSIVKGRSVCTNCKHKLAWYDLVPVLSWLTLRGKCRYCKIPISIQYPIIEVITAVLFVVSYSFWPLGLESLFDQVYFGAWLASLVGLVALVVYDIKWMLLPNRIVFPLIGLASIGVVIRALSSDSTTSTLLNALGGLAVAGGIFFTLFQISNGKWIGGGDVKLGFALGLMLGSPSLAFLMLFSASLLGLIVTLPAVALKKTDFSSKIPFGPFLIMATIIAKLFGDSVIDWYSTTFLYL